MRAFSVSQTVQYASLVALSLLVTACSSISNGSHIHTSAKGSVQLQEVSDWSFEASHPVIIDHLTMLKVVKGLWADDDLSVSSNKMPARGSKPMRAFSDEDAEFLAPLLAQGLSQAKPEQIVGFTVSSSAGSGAEPTVGTLYVQGGGIHLTMGSPKGKKVWTFSPGTAARIEKAPSFAAARTPGALAIVIDYQALAKSPSPHAVPIAAVSKKMQMIPTPLTPITQGADTIRSQPVGFTAVTDPMSGSQDLSTDEILSKKLDELRQARETNALKESEIQMLRKEAEWMKRELRERSAELKTLRTNQVSSRPAAKKKPAEARPFPN
jgi:hypothetical protein